MLNQGANAYILKLLRKFENYKKCMKTRYQFSITGMTCHSCSSLIQMDLEDAELVPRSVESESGRLVIDLEPQQVEKVKDIIHKTQKYMVAAVQQIS